MRIGVHGSELCCHLVEEKAAGTMWSMVPNKSETPCKTQVLNPTVLSLVVSVLIK